MEKDSDWLYRQISIAWLSVDATNLETCGFGFNDIFDEMACGDDLTMTSHPLQGWEFVAYWYAAEFPGWNAITFLVFRKPAG
jgi:hypothetical protein